MEFIDSHAFQQWAFQFTIVLFLLGGLVVLAVGVGLIVSSTGTFRLFGVMNRWVSTRRALRVLEIPRDSRPLVRRHRHWLALVFVCGAAFALYGLGTGFDPQAVSFVLDLDVRPSSIASWLIESVRWVLIAGNLAAIVIGVMLGFAPGALAALEARGARWYSHRRLGEGGDAMNLPLDNWVAAFPRAAGWIITVAGLVMVGDFGIVWFAVR